MGRKYRGELFVGAAKTSLKGGYLFHFNLTRKRNALGVNDPRLKDRVADYRAKFGLTESQCLLIGRGASECDVVSHRRLLERIYCNGTATGLIRVGTQWDGRRHRSRVFGFGKPRNGTRRYAIGELQANS
jgi:hypothetical protein